MKLKKLKKNRFWYWQSYAKALTLYRPLSYLAIFVVIALIISCVANILENI